MEQSSICRLCLAQDLEFFDIFAASENVELSLVNIVEIIAPETVERDDELSKVVCGSCRDTCNDFIKFRQLIQTSHNYLQVALRNEKETNEEAQESVVIEYIDDDQIIEEEIEDLACEDLDLGISDLSEERAHDIFESEDNISISELAADESEEEEKMFSSKSFKTNSPKRLFPCVTCKRKFTSSVMLMRHEIIHSDLVTAIKHESGHRCIICNITFGDKPTLEDHIREHKIQIESNAILCIYCDKTFDKLNNLIRHLKSHEENKTHLCNVCNKTFAMGQDLIDHLNRHKGFLPHRCNICNKSYLQASKLKNHLKTHANDKEFLCTECGKSFNRNSNLRQHLLRHVGIKKFHCAQCPAKFVSKGNLTAHMSTHDQKKPYACTICGSSFTQSYSLVKHNRIHTGERPFQCEYCQMRFYSSDHLKRHIRTHTGEKPYKCEFCPKSFAQNGDLNKHKRLHIGDNTYKCTEAGCTEAFRLQAELRDHMKIHYCK